MVYANAVLDSDAHAPKGGRPSVIMRNINTRLDGNAVAAAKGLATAVSRAVMHVKTDIVADMVGEELIDVGHCDFESNSAQLVDKSTRGNIVNVL
ncbi:hypothetical protein HG531_008658 [Fusarium graminearum]|nr:hypothetical protein HG531_008658 [Fusarium graminearum]